jgi:hypothetical protein
LLKFSYPIRDALQSAADAAEINISEWPEEKRRGIWTRVAPVWKARADKAGIRWGSQTRTGHRDSQISSQILPITGGPDINCRPMERIGSSPYPIPFDPAEVFVLTVASELVMTRSGKTKKWVEQTLELRLRLSDRLIRTSIMASFSHPASIFQGTAPTLISHFLLPPISAISGVTRFKVQKNSYGRIWPDESMRPVRDCVEVQNLLDCGNDQKVTLVLLAHRGYDHIGWIGWAEQMRNMSVNSMFGIGYTCVYFHLLLLLYLYCPPQC